VVANLVRKLAVALLLFSTNAAAYRPFDGTDAGVAEHGQFELELGPVGYLGSRGKHFLSAPAVIANVGILEDWEFVAQSQQLIALDGMADPRVRLADTSAFLKGVLRRGVLQDETGPSIAVEIGPLLPDAGSGDKRLGFSISSILSQRWWFGTIHLNGAWVGTRAGNPDLFLGAIVEGPYTWRLRPVMELFWEREFGADERVSILQGVIFRLGPEFSLDAGLRLGHVADTNIFEARAGFTWAFRIWKT
jgi:hypothetical protein